MSNFMLNCVRSLKQSQFTLYCVLRDAYCVNEFVKRTQFVVLPPGSLGTPRNVILIGLMK